MAPLLFMFCFVGHFCHIHGRVACRVTNCFSTMIHRRKLRTDHNPGSMFHDTFHVDLNLWLAWLLA
jgi:hypothetical protein